MRSAWLLVAVMACAGSSLTAEDQGEALLERTCTKCHTLDGIARQRNSKERWAAIVDDMVSRGAEATDAEIEKIVDYLVKNTGPKVNVNKASVQDLVAKLGLSEAASAAIVASREKNGSFKTLEDLKKIESVDPKEIENRKTRIDF